MNGSLVRICTLTRPHGVRGAFCARADGEALAAFAPGATVVVRTRAGTESAMTIAALQLSGDHWLIRFDAIGDRTAAEAYRFAEVLAPREQLPPLEEGRFYYADLIGLAVLTEAGEHLGTLCDIWDNSAHEIFQVVDADERELLIPAVEPFIVEINPEAGRVVVRLLEGMRDAD